MYAMLSAANRDVTQLRATGGAEAMAHLDSWSNSPLKAEFYARTDKMLTRDVNIFSNITLSDWLNVSNAFVDFLFAQDKIVLGKITNGDLLRTVALNEGLKMLGAVVACVIAAALVIFFNSREQEKLETALRSTRILARAINRFCPKNQLRTMGVRSIVEVQAGLHTEVATVMLTCGMNTDLARVMTNTELFDFFSQYLQKMTQITQQQKGYVDLFFGDQLHNVFQVPKNAVNAALLMQSCTSHINSTLIAEGRDTTLSVGIGIHHLIAVTGVFGDSSSRLSVAMISSEGMLATRLEGMTKTFGSKIIATEPVIQHLPANFQTIGGKGYRYRLLGTVTSRLNRKDRMANQLMTSRGNSEAGATTTTANFSDAEDNNNNKKKKKTTRFNIVDSGDEGKETEDETENGRGGEVRNNKYQSSASSSSIRVKSADENENEASSNEKRPPLKSAQKQKNTTRTSKGIHRKLLQRSVSKSNSNLRSLSM
jgi:class 3 adenylate cyclase